MVSFARETASGLKCYMLYWVAMVFVLSLIVQVLLIFFGEHWMIIYSPVIDLLLPMLKRHFGGGDGSLGPVLLTGSLIGALIYSALLGCLAALFVRWGGDAASTRSLPDSPEIAEQKSTAVPIDGTSDEKLAHLVKRPP
jgi:hypothetical protein